MTDATQTATDLAGATPARALDLRGETCPAPTDRTLAVLEEMAPGEVLELACDYYPAKSTIPWLCDKRGYRYALFDESQPVWRMRIQKV